MPTVSTFSPLVPSTSAAEHYGGLVVEVVAQLRHVRLGRLKVVKQALVLSCQRSSRPG